MARDPDAIKIAGIHETRGRQSKAIRAKTRTDTLKGFEATAKGLTRSLDFALPLGLFAFTSWSSRLKITATAGSTSFGLFAPDRLNFRLVRPTYQGRPVMQLDFGYPGLHAAEGIGMLEILISMPGSDLIGLVENGLALMIYHVFLNGGTLNIGGALNAARAITDPIAWIQSDPLGHWLGLYPAGSTSTTDRLVLLGMFPSQQWRIEHMQAVLQKEIDAGKMDLPDPEHVLPEPVDVSLDGPIRRIQLDRAIKALAHAAFLTLLLKRGGGVVPTE